VLSGKFLVTGVKTFKELEAVVMGVIKKLQDSILM
jgi:hypothetical protein